MIKIFHEDILNAREKYIVHQTNCYSIGDAAGLAYEIFKKFPYADCYKNRQSISKPGTIDIRGDGQNQRFVINLMGQYYPGKFNNNSLQDTEKFRQFYFHKALNKIAKLSNLESVAFPYGISCGLAGGNWKWYFGELENFEKLKTKVIIYRKD